MKIIGLIGGIGPASTLDYYMGIICGYRQKMGELNYPEIIIYSIDMNEMMLYIENERWDMVIDQLSGAANSLEAAGADFIAIASNTPHLVFEQVSGKSPVPLLSIVEETCKFAKAAGCKRVLTMGTLFAMRSGLYTDPLKKRGIFAIVPSDTEQNEIHSLFFPNLENGIVIDEDKNKMIDIVEKIIREQDADSVILGCTELPLMIKQGDLSVPVINTTQIHIDAIIDHICI